MRSFLTFLAIGCVIGSSFSTLAVDEKARTTDRPSKESSPGPDEKADESVPREFLGFAEVTEFRGVIDDPDGKSKPC
jgi:hypothetical protein